LLKNLYTSEEIREILVMNEKEDLINTRAEKISNPIKRYIYTSWDGILCSISALALIGICLTGNLSPYAIIILYPLMAPAWIRRETIFKSHMLPKGFIDVVAIIILYIIMITMSYIIYRK
jgi:hypothetical protein